MPYLFVLKIKNSVRTAQALAVNKNEKLSMEHLNLVLAVTEGFEHDLKGTGQLESTKPPWHGNAATNTTNNHLTRYDVLCVKIFRLVVMQKPCLTAGANVKLWFLLLFSFFLSFFSLLRNVGTWRSSCRLELGLVGQINRSTGTDVMGKIRLWEVIGTKIWARLFARHLFIDY